MAVALNKFEKSVVFLVFLTIASLFVGAAYVLTATDPGPAAAPVVAEIAVVPPPSAASETPATQPVRPLRFVPVATTTDLPPVATVPIDWPSVEFTSPTTQPAVIAIASPPATKPMEPVVAKNIVALAPPVAPYTIDLPASRVTHIYVSELANQPTWCELKLEPAHITALTTAAANIAARDHRELDEFDRLALASPRPDLTLPWWRPAELIDPDLVVVSSPASQACWIALSRRTGRVFLYADRPVDFIAAR